MARSNRRLARLLALFTVAAAGLMTHATPAMAAFKFCNKTSYVVAAALGYDTQGKRYSQGWLVLQSGECGTALDAPLEGKRYFTFAHTLSFHEGPVKYFAGAVPLCASDGTKDFKIVGQEDCERRGFNESPFAVVDTGGAADWTTSFTEPSDYSLEAARIAGVQRLLSDVGVKRMRVDGYLGDDTKGQIIKFKKAHGLQPDTTLPDTFFDALIEEAETIERTAGFSFCNDTDAVAWGALGYHEGDEDIATGWFKIAPHSCLKAIKDRLRDSEYFAYATLDPGAGHPMEWAGDYLFCTMENRFTIKGRDDCEARGYLATGFERFTPDASGGATKHLRANDARARP